MNSLKEVCGSDDDTSDEEYVPGGEDCAQLSEVESDGEPEENINSDGENSSTKQRKRKSKTKSKPSKKSKADDILENNHSTEIPLFTEEEQKKKTDSLWADFLKDTDFKPKPKITTLINDKNTISPKKIEITKVNEKAGTEKQKVPIILEFAGEKIDTEGNIIEKLSTPVARSGGISSVLSQLGKKQKITTLEKTKLDWDRFKRDENINDELRAHNMGKNGYLERQDFLQRADLRQFEIEKEARAIKRTHRS